MNNQEFVNRQPQQQENELTIPCVICSDEYLRFEHERQNNWQCPKCDEDEWLAFLEYGQE
jgi:hypothetical protein